MPIWTIHYSESDVLIHNVTFPKGFSPLQQNPMLDVTVSTLILNLRVVYKVIFSTS